ncbi:uncharacterized, partial [Tachysurus ichikawai]
SWPECVRITASSPIQLSAVRFGSSCMPLCRSAVPVEMSVALLRSR